MNHQSFNDIRNCVVVFFLTCKLQIFLNKRFFSNRLIPAFYVRAYAQVDLRLALTVLYYVVWIYFPQPAQIDTT